MRITCELPNSISSRFILAAAILVCGSLLGAIFCHAQEPAEEEVGAVQKSDEMKAGKSNEAAVLAIIEKEPTTPAELLAAARSLADLNRPDLARKMIERVVEANLDEAALAAVVDELGEAALKELASKPLLQAKVAPLVKESLDAYEARPKDPAVLAILETKPTTPAELLRAARILADLKRPFLAKEMIKQVADANLDQAALAGLVDELGEAALVELASKSQLRPGAGPLVERILAAHQARVQDAARLDQAVAQLGDENPKIRADAAVALIKAGSHAVAPLMAALADPAQEARHEAIRGVILRLGPDAVKPLIALLNADEAVMVQEAAPLLAVLGDKGGGALPARSLRGAV